MKDITSERPIQKKSVSADTDNWPLLPILSADISADNEAKRYAKIPKILYLLLSKFEK